MKELFKCSGGGCKDINENSYIHTVSEDNFVECKKILSMMNMNYLDYKGGYVFNSLEDFISKYESIKILNMKNGSTGDIVKSIKSLDTKKKICVNVEGIFTILGSIINPVVLFKASRKNKEQLLYALDLIENFLKKYIAYLKENNVDIISFADPSGNYDIVGPKFFNEFIAPSCIRIINYMKNNIKISAVHVCGKLSTALKKEGYITINSINFREDIEYAKGICSLFEKGPLIIGHSCTKTFNVKRQIIWEIKS